MVLKVWKKSRHHNVSTLDRPARITGMPTHQLREWMGVEIMQLGANYDQWMLHGLDEEEVTERLDAITSMWDELVERVAAHE